MFRNQEWMTLSTRHGDFDVVFVPDGTGGYEEIASSATLERIAGTQVVVPVASAEIVLRSKEAADRPKDKAVLDDMRKVLDPWRSRAEHDPPER